MRISKEILVNVNAVAYSPCGKYLALSFFNELTIVRTSDGVVVFNVQCSDRITSVAWSVDSDHILCVVANALVEAFSMSSPEWNCTIHEGTVGLSSAVWSPKGTHIVTVAEFSVRLSVWSLIGRSVAFIENPLMKAKDKLSFSPDGKFLALATGKIGRFNISIFSTSWTEMSCMTCTQGIIFPSVPAWSPDGSYISVWETIDLASPKVEIYGVREQQKIGYFTIGPNKWAPRGISSVVWAPNSQFLLIGCRNDSIYVLNYINWSVVGILKHESIVIEKECEVLQDINGRFSKVRERPVRFISKARKLPGIAKIMLCSDGVLVASLCQLLPAVVWIWDLESFSLLAILSLRNCVIDLKWGRGHKLCICDGSTLTFWQSGGTKQICLESNRKIKKIKKCAWHPGTRDHFLIFTQCSVFMVSGS